MNDRDNILQLHNNIDLFADELGLRIKYNPKASTTPWHLQEIARNATWQYLTLSCVLFNKPTPQLVTSLLLDEPINWVDYEPKTQAITALLDLSFEALLEVARQELKSMFSCLENTTVEERENLQHNEFQWFFNYSSYLNASPTSFKSRSGYKELTVLIRNKDFGSKAGRP